MKDDRFMSSLREEPRPEFAESLRQRLMPESEREERRPHRMRRLVPGFATAAVALAAVALFVFPSVRASAQAFLDLFRVRSFAAIPFDPARLEKLSDLPDDGRLLLFEGGAPPVDNPPTPVASRAEAEAAAGIPVLEPGYLPEGFARDSFQAVASRNVRAAINSEQLRLVVDVLDLRDVDVPDDLDGQWIDVTVPTIVHQSWAKKNVHMQLVQARSPEVSLPAGLNLAQLGEIGLRILGFDEREAGRLARSIDWNSTLIVPVPTSASGFREVIVRGHEGLLITTDKMVEAPGGEKHRRQGALLLWTEDGRVFALSGNIEQQTLLATAESLR